ncbi:MAG TPA: universal stress protein [Ramlibacter sp.]|nr:universal stress protein [Ramlibacter sp.]
MYHRILVATDNSKLSRKAEKTAIELAAATGANLVAMHVIPDYPMSYFEGGITVSAAEVAKLEASWADKGRAIVDAVVASAAQSGVKARGVIAHSDHVADTLVAGARKHKCDLIVMASHGRRGIRRVLLGSETQHVLTHSTVPVLVLR